MFRALTILAAVAALAVSASPVSAGPPPRPKPAGFIDISTTETLDMVYARGRAQGRLRTTPPKPSQVKASGVANTLDVAGHNVGFIKDGTSNTATFAE